MTNILDGELQKLGEKGLVKTYKRRNFRLRDDGFLRYYDGATEKGAVDMTIVTEVRTEDEDGVDFDIVTEGRVYHLKAATNEDMKYWLKGLNEYLHPTTAAGSIVKKAKKAAKKTKEGAAAAAKKTKGAAAKAKDEVASTATKTARTIQYGEALTDEEVAQRERQKEAEKAKKEKEKAKIKKAEEKERARHEAEKEKIKDKKAKMKAKG